MDIKEAKEIINELIDTCIQGAEMHPYDKDLFLGDKKALEVLQIYISNMETDIVNKNNTIEHLLKEKR